MTEEEINALIHASLRNRVTRQYWSPIAGANRDGSGTFYVPAPFLPEGSGLITPASAVDDGSISSPALAGRPRIMLYVNEVAEPEANACAESCEVYNNEPFGYPTGEGDAMWGLYNEVFGVMRLEITFGSFSDTARMGISFGSPFQTNATFAQNNIWFALYRDMFAGKWELSVCNKWAAVGHRLFTVDLGNAPGGIPSFTVPQSQPFRLELRWYPGANDTSRVEAWINRNKVYTFTDAQDGGGDFPLRGIYDNVNSTGETVKGGGCFLTVKSANDRAKALCWGLTCETWETGAPA